MKPVALFLSLVVCAGCSSDDVRLHGTWRSNREATVAEIFRADAHWATASPECRPFRQLERDILEPRHHDTD